MKNKIINGADLFCGAGGFTRGFILACKTLGLEYRFTAINHWDVAIATHSQNHPDVAHILDDMQKVDPKVAVKQSRLDILLASPECTHHSNAAGGRPKNPQSRATAGYVIKWAKAVRPRIIIVENVREFRHWGPLSKKGTPLKRRKGELFNKWVRSLQRLGYTVDHKVLCAANYGDPTTRERLFIIARCDGKSIEWPVPTHSKKGATSLFGDMKSWRTARDAVIEWDVLGQSIFNRKKPLSPNTMRRIWAGLEKFGGEAFLAILHGTSKVRSVDEPTPTVAASGAHAAVVEPETFMLRMDQGGSNGGFARPANQPVATVTAKPMLGLVQAELKPYIVGVGGPKGSSRHAKSVDEPMSTVLPDPHLALVTPDPFILSMKHTTEGGTGKQPRKTVEPMPTITARPDLALVESEAFMLPLEGVRGHNVPHPTSDPLATVTQRGVGHLVQASLVKINGGNDPYDRGASSDEPVGAITTHPAIGLLTSFMLPQQSAGQPRSVDDPTPTVAGAGAVQHVEPYLIQYNRTPDVVSVDNPVPTATGKDRFALAEPFLIEYHGANRPNGERVRSVDQPAPTIATCSQFALVLPGMEGWALDIRLRMLTVRELARAQGFPDDFQFTGTIEKRKKQIGNAVPVNMAKALCLSQMRTL